MQKLFLTFFYFGLLKPAPGTWGSLAGLVPAILIYEYIGASTLFLASILLFLVSINIINNYEKKLGIHDASHIVIDEVAGIWIGVSFCGGSLVSYILVFLFFRFFDITKPSIIGKIDKNVKGGLGVMGDDMVAGALAGIFAALTNALLDKTGFLNLEIIKSFNQILA